MAKKIQGVAGVPPIPAPVQQFASMNKRLNAVQNILAANPVPGKLNIGKWLKQMAGKLHFAAWVPNIPAPMAPQKYKRKIQTRVPQQGFSTPRIKIQKTGTPSFSKASTKSPPKIKKNKKGVKITGGWNRSIILSAVNFYKLRKYRGKKYSLEKILELIKKALDKNKSISLAK